MIHSALVQNWLLADNALGSLFASERERVVNHLSQSERTAASRLQAALRDWRAPSRFEEIGSGFARLSRSLRKVLTESVFLNVNRLIVLESALRLPQAVARQNIPDEVQSLYPAALQRLVEFLQCADDPNYFYPNDFFLKDIRFASGLTVPCGAQVVDLRSSIGYRAYFHNFLQGRSSTRLPRTLDAASPGSWFRIHTETRHLVEFNETGWEMCYRRIAALLAAHPEVRGMVGASWFYDPQLENTSPHLTYLRRRPLERGASFLRNGTTDYDIRMATAKSATRRRLYEAGKYAPVSYTLLWPREALLAWARNADDARR